MDLTLHPLYFTTLLLCFYYQLGHVASIDMAIVFETDFHQSTLLLSLCQTLGQKVDGELDGGWISIGIMSFIDILKLFVLGCCILIELYYIFTPHKLINSRRYKQQRGIYIPHTFYWLQLLDIKIKLLFDLRPQIVQQMLNNEARNNTPIRSNLFDQIPQRSIRRVEYASCNFLAILGLAEIEDNSKQSRKYLWLHPLTSPIIKSQYCPTNAPSLSSHPNHETSNTPNLYTHPMIDLTP